LFGIIVNVSDNVSILVSLVQRHKYVHALLSNIIWYFPYNGDA